MNDKGKQFYEYLSSKEIKVPNTYEEFQSSMQDSATASQFHSFVKSKGITVPESVDEFSSVFSIDGDVKKKDTTSVPPTQNEVPVSTEPEIGLDESGQEISLAPSSETPEYLKETSYQTFKGQKAREEKAAPVQSYEETQKTLSGIDKEISKAELSKQRFPGTQKPERLSQLKSEREAVAKASGQLVEETQKDITSIVNEGIGSNWEDFLSDDGVIDVSKIGDFARAESIKYGVPEDGYFFQRVKDAAQSKVELEKIAPSVDKNFADIYKDMYGVKPGDAAEDMLSRDDLQKSLGIAQLNADFSIQMEQLQKNIEKSSGEEIDVINKERYGMPVDEYASSIANDYKKRQESISEDYKTLEDKYAPFINEKNEFTGGPEMYQEYNSSLEEINSLAKESDDLYKNNFESFVSQNTKDVAEINNKYNRRFNRQQQEILKAYKNEYTDKAEGINPLLQERYQKAYGIALEKAMKEEERFKETKIRMGTEILFGSNSGIIASGYVNTSSYISGVANNLKSLSRAMGSDGEFWEQVAKDTDAGDTELNGFKDWINPSKLGKSISYTLGGMTPGLVASIGTGGVGAYVGAGSLATTLAAGTAGWGVESATIVQDAYDQKFKETGSATKAEDAAAKSLKGQVVLMPMYALEMVPFFGDLSTKLGKIGLDNMAARFAVGGATETVSEQFQEYGQQLFEQAIADDKDLSDAFDYASVKGFKDTFVNVAPTTLFLGGGGAALDIKTSKEDMAKSLVMKAKIGNLTDAALEQSMLKITVNQGQKFAKAFIDTQLRNGAITEDQATKATIAIDSSVATIEKGKKYNLDNKNNYILASLDLKLKVAKEKAEAESDPMMKGIADRNVKNIEKQAQKLMETGNADVAVVTYPDNSFDVLTHAEARMAMSKDDFMQPFVDGDLKIEAMGSEQKTLMDELKERSKRFKPTKQQKIFEKSIEEEKNKSRKKGILRTIGEKISKASAKRYNKRVYASLDKIYQNELDYYEQALEDAREGEDDFQIDYYEEKIKEIKSSTPEQVAQTELDLQNRYLEEEFTGDEEMGRSNQIDRVAGIERLEELLGQTPTEEQVERRQFIIDNVKDDTQVTEQEPVGTEEQGREEDPGQVQEPEVSEEEGDADSVLQEQKEVDAENKKIDEEEKRIDKEIEYLDIQIENFEEEISNSNSNYKSDVAEIKEKFKQKIADVKKKKVSKAKQSELIEDLKEEQAAELEDRKEDRDGEIEGYRDDIKQEKADKRKALNEKKKLEASRPKIKEAPKSKKKAKEPSKKEEVKEPAKEKEETAGTTEEELSAIEQELEKQKGGIFSEKRKRKKLVKAVRNGIKAISKALPNVKIKLHKNNQEFVDAGVTGERKEGYDLSAGIYDPETKTIHINLELADVRDVAHEVFHAFLLDNLSTNEEAAVISKRLVDNLKKIEGNNTSLIKELEDHANKYKEEGKGVMKEEMIAEFVGIISENYNSMSARGKRAVVEFLNSMLEVARKVNPEISDLLPSKVSGNEVVDMLTAIGEKVAKGEEIEQADVKELDLIKEAPYEGGDFVEVNPEGPKTPQPRQSKADNIYEDVPFSKKLPIITLQAFANKVKGKLFAVTSDATGLGFDSKGDRIDGGFGYSSIPENVDEGVGFASLSPDVAKKTLSKIAKRFKAGEKIGIMIMVQNPSATIGNYYGGKYLGRGLALLKKTNDQAYSEVINGVQKILDENKTVKKDLKKKNKTSNKIMELVSSPEKYSETEFAKQWILDTTFETRRILLKTLFIKSQQTRVTKKTNKAKLALKDAGFDMQSFLMEYGDIKLLGENNLREDNGGFVVGGFEMEVPKDIPATIEELKTRGIEHPQFNGKIPSNGNNYMFDGLYPIQDNFVGYVKPETQIIEGLKDEADAAVRDMFQNETSYKDEVVTGDAETNPKYVEENERGYTDLKSGPKIKFKAENPYLLEPKTPGVVASVAKGLGINIIKDIPTEGAFKSPESRVSVRQKKIEKVQEETNFVPVSFWVESLKGNVGYLDNVIEHILEARTKLENGEISPERVIKSYLITLGSMGSGGGYYSNWQKKTGQSIDPMFIENQNNREWLRPEGAAAAYLVTDEGKKLVQSIKNNTATEDQIKKLFEFIGVGRESKKAGYVVSTLAKNGLSSMTNLFNENKGKDFKELYSGAIKNLTGVGEGKTGFFNQFLGISGRGVVDAREINAWVSGSMKLTDKQKLLKKKIEGSPKIQQELLNKIEEVGIELGYPEDMAAYIAHHAIWDKIAGSITKHEGEYLSVRQKKSAADIRKEEQKREEKKLYAKIGMTPEEVSEWKKSNKKGIKMPHPAKALEAAKKYEAGEISLKKYDQEIKKHMPIFPYKQVPTPATVEEIVLALSGDKAIKGIVGLTMSIEDGTIVSSRLDIPAYMNFGIYVDTIHGPKGKGVLGYGETVVLENVTFNSKANLALKIATTSDLPQAPSNAADRVPGQEYKANKSPFAVMEGAYKNEDTESAVKRAEEALKSDEWVQVGFNPYRHAYFYDKANSSPVVSAKEVIQVGPLVMAKGVVYGEPLEFKDKKTGLTVRFKKSEENPLGNYAMQTGEVGGVVNKSQPLRQKKVKFNVPKKRLYEQTDKVATFLTRGYGGKFINLPMSQIEIKDTKPMIGAYGQPVGDMVEVTVPEWLYKKNDNLSKIKYFELVSEPTSGITPRQKKVKIEPSVIKKNAIPAVNFIKNVSLKAEDGLTMNLDGTKYEGGGLVVPIASINLNQSSVKPSSVSDFISKNKGKLSNDTFKVGLYKFPEESTVSIDLNIIVPNENRKVAVEVGKMLNQESLFDLDSGENVKTGGTGKNTLELTDEQASDLAKDLAENKRPGLLTVRQKIKGAKAKQRGFFKNKFEEFKKNIAFESEEFKKNIAFDPANPTLDGLGNIPDIIKEKPEAYYEPQVYSEIKDELRYMTESQLVDSMSLDGLYGIMNASGSTNNNMGVLAAAELINRKLKDGQDVESAIIQLGRMGTTIGQLLRQFGELKKSTPAGVLYAIEKIAERNNIELTKENRSVIQGKIQDRFDIIDKIDKLQEKARAKGIKPSKLKEINKEINKLKSDLYPVDSSLRVYINKAIPTPIGKAIIQILQGNLLTTGSIVTNVFANIWQTGVLLPVNITASILELARVGVGRAFGLKSNREASISIGGLIYGAKSVIGSLPDVFRTLVWKGPKSDYQEMVRQDINTNMLGWKAWTVLIGKNMTLPVPKSGSKLDKILGSLNKELGDKKFFARTNIALSLFSQGTFGLPADIMFRMLQAGDLIFKRPWKEISLYERGKMKGLKGSELEAFIKYPSKKEYDRAIEVAKEATFQEDSTLALGSSKIVTALVEFAGGLADKVFLGNIARLLMRSQFPYVKTPANIVNWVAKAAVPQLAFAASIVYYAKGDYRKGANNFGIGVTGLMMSNAAAILVANGLAQGSGEEDENEKSRVQQMEWILFPPNTINTTAIQRMMSWLEEGYESGDGEFMKRLEIMSNGEVPKDITLPRPKDVKRNYTKSGIPGAILGIIAGSSKAQVESRLLNPVEENVLEKLGGDVLKIPSVIAYTTQQSFLQGTYSLLNALSGSDYETKNWMDNTFKAVSSVALPNQLSVINKAEREYMPDLRSRNITESWNNMILDKTFGTDGLPVRRDMWGRPIRQTPENVSPLIYQYGLDPTRPSREEENKVMYDLYEIWDKTRDSKVYPSKEKRTHNVTYNGKKRGVYFEAENMDDYQRIVGALRLEAVENEMLKSSWSRRTDEQKVERLGQLYKVTNQKFRISLTPDLKKKYSIAKDKITVKEYKLKIIDSILQDMIKEGREIK